MRLLFILDNLSEMCGSNVDICVRWIPYWTQRGHSVSALVRTDRYNYVDERLASLFDHVYTIPIRENEVLISHTRTEKWRGLNSPGRMIYLFDHPDFLLYLIDFKFFRSRLPRKEYSRRIEEVYSAEGYDAVLTVTEPFFLAEMLSKARIPCKSFLVMMDPYANNYTLPDRGRYYREILERRVLEKYTSIFALNFVRDNLEYLPDGINSRIFGFPVSKITGDDQACGSVSGDLAEHEYIDFVYAGHFYSDIRNPKYLLDLFLRLPDRYRLHIYGAGSAEHIIDRYDKLLGERLIRHGMVSSSEANRAIRSADILVNVNNTVLNAMPSKLVEYIDSGRPIINICMIDDCPSHYYIDRYPNGISISVSDDIESASHSVERFVESSLGRVIDHDTIEAVFADCTEKAVAEMIISHIENN